MKIGTKIWTKESDIGIYLYPHKKPVKDETICSVLSTKECKIYNVLYKDIESYKHHCWNCKEYVELDSFTHKTCPTCHWIKCPKCGACRQGGCIDDGLTILEYGDNESCEEQLGFSLRDFLDPDAYLYESLDCYKEDLSKGLIREDDNLFYYLGQGLPRNVDNCIIDLLNNNINVIVFIDEIGLISLYTYAKYAEKAIDILNKIDAKLYDSLIDEGL